MNYVIIGNSCAGTSCAAEIRNIDKKGNILGRETSDQLIKDLKGKVIGEVVEGEYVIVNTPIGGERILEAPIADPVPRVC